MIYILYAYHRLYIIIFLQYYPFRCVLDTALLILWQFEMRNYIFCIFIAKHSWAKATDFIWFTHQLEKVILSVTFLNRCFYLLCLFNSYHSHLKWSYLKDENGFYFGKIEVKHKFSLFKRISFSYTSFVNVRILIVVV